MDLYYREASKVEKNYKAEENNQKDNGFVSATNHKNIIANKQIESIKEKNTLINNFDSEKRLLVELENKRLNEENLNKKIDEPKKKAEGFNNCNNNYEDNVDNKNQKAEKIKVENKNNCDANMNENEDDNHLKNKNSKKTNNSSGNNLNEHLKEEGKNKEKMRKKNEFLKLKKVSEIFFEKVISQSNKYDYFSILQDVEKNENYLKYKILYEAIKSNKNKLKLTNMEFIKYLFNSDSYDVKNFYELKNNNESSKKRLILYNIAKQKLRIDFDIVNILKTIDHFNDFKNIFMDEKQLRLFEFAIKKISNSKFNNDSLPKNGGDHKKITEKEKIIQNKRAQKHENLIRIYSTEEGLTEMFEEIKMAGLNNKHLNILKCIGINETLLKELEQLKLADNGIWSLSNFLIFKK